MIVFCVANPASQENSSFKNQNPFTNKEEHMTKETAQKFESLVWNCALDIIPMSFLIEFARKAKIKMGPSLDQLKADFAESPHGDAALLVQIKLARLASKTLDSDQNHPTIFGKSYDFPD